MTALCKALVNSRNFSCSSSGSLPVGDAHADDAADDKFELFPRRGTTFLSIGY